MFAELLQTVSLSENVKLYRSIGDILIRGNSPEVEMAPEKSQESSTELKF